MAGLSAIIKQKILADAGAPAEGEVLLVRERGDAAWSLRVASGDAELSDRGLVVGCLPANTNRIGAGNDESAPYYYQNWKRFRVGVPLSAQI